MKAHFLRFLFVWLIYSLSPTVSFAQLEADQQTIANQIWIDLIPHFMLGENLEFYGDGSIRLTPLDKRTTLMIRPSMRWQFNPYVALHGGIGVFYNDFKEDPNNLEIRPWQAVRIGYPDFWRLKFKHYIRIEQRLFLREGSDNEFLHRLRYQIKAKLPINKPYVAEKTWYIPFAYEWLGSASEGLDNLWASQSRAMVGVGYVLSKKWIFEFEYMHWWSRDIPSLPYSSSDRIFRLKFIKSGWIFDE